MPGVATRWESRITNDCTAEAEAMTSIALTASSISRLVTVNSFHQRALHTNEFIDGYRVFFSPKMHMADCSFFPSIFGFVIAGKSQVLVVKAMLCDDSMTACMHAQQQPPDTETAK